jgi:hypothetical protein
VIAGVADTHTALWYLFKNPRLSAAARSFMDDAASAGHDIVLSPISLAEIVYLVEKGRLPESAYDELRKALDNPGLDHGFDGAIGSFVPRTSLCRADKATATSRRAGLERGNFESEVGWNRGRRLRQQRRNTDNPDSKATHNFSIMPLRRQQRHGGPLDPRFPSRVPKSTMKAWQEVGKARPSRRKSTLLRPIVLP